MARKKPVRREKMLSALHSALRLKRIACERDNSRTLASRFRDRPGRANTCPDKHVEFVGKYTQKARCDERNNNMQVIACLEQKYSKGYRPKSSEVSQQLNINLSRAEENGCSKMMLEKEDQS